MRRVARQDGQAMLILLAAMLVAVVAAVVLGGVAQGIGKGGREQRAADLAALAGARAMHDTFSRLFEPAEIGGAPNPRHLELAAHKDLGRPARSRSPTPTSPTASTRGHFAYPQGKPMSPDVALAVDRLNAAAHAAGISLIVVSAFRSNAEQAVLYPRHPDPKWVAPPGKSLHRLGTELDLGPPSAYQWLYANAGRFGFIKRSSWEPWH
jgi:hypothetical protein